MPDDVKQWSGETVCPKCAAWVDDPDGLGVFAHDECGYCSHPSLTGNVCDICGFVEPATAQPQRWSCYDEHRLSTGRAVSVITEFDSMLGPDDAPPLTAAELEELTALMIALLKKSGAQREE